MRVHSKCKFPNFPCSSNKHACILYRKYLEIAWSQLKETQKHNAPINPVAVNSRFQINSKSGDLEFLPRTAKTLWAAHFIFAPGVACKILRCALEKISMSWFNCESTLQYSRSDIRVTYMCCQTATDRRDSSVTRQKNRICISGYYKERYKLNGRTRQGPNNTHHVKDQEVILAACLECEDRTRSDV